MPCGTRQVKGVMNELIKKKHEVKRHFFLRGAPFLKGLPVKWRK